MRKLLMAVLTTFSSLAMAAPYPGDGPITIIVPFSAGGPTDRLARDLAPILTKTIGQQVIVENMPGAGGSIGIAKLAKGVKADGYTIGIANIGLATYPALYGNNLRFDSKTDLEPIAFLANVPQVLVVNKQFGANNFKDFIEYAKKNPGKVNLANAGVGSASHLAGLLLAERFKLQFNEVPYKGLAPAMTDVIGGQVDGFFTQTTQLGGGIVEKIKPLAVTSLKPLPAYGQLPTVAQSSPGFELVVWHGVVAPRNLPKETLAKLTKATQDAIKSPEFKMKVEALSAQIPADTSPGMLTKTIDSQTKLLNTILKSVKAEQ